MKNLIVIISILGLFSVSDIYSENNFQERQENKSKQRLKNRIISLKKKKIHLPKQILQLPQSPPSQAK